MLACFPLGPEENFKQMSINAFENAVCQVSVMLSGFNKSKVHIHLCLKNTIYEPTAPADAKYVDYYNNIPITAWKLLLDSVDMIVYDLIRVKYVARLLACVTITATSSGGLS